MEAALLIMSKKEQDRSEVIRLYVEGSIKQKEAAKRLGVSTRQIRNVAHAYRLHGAHELIHGNRGKASNRKIREAIKQSALQWVRKPYGTFTSAIKEPEASDQNS